MGKLLVFEITFSNQSCTFYAGSRMEGEVSIQLTEAMKMRGIRMKFEGQANVYWVESDDSDQGGHADDHISKAYSAQETYFDQDVLLHGTWPKGGSETIELHAGWHTFPFTFQLPPNAPSSFESETGHVRYMAKCFIDKPWKFDHKTKSPFTVINILDLNQNPQYAQSIQAQKSKYLCCLCCKSGPIEASFHIKRQGWVSGEPIKLYADISNGTNRVINKSYVTLIMRTTFRAWTRNKTEEKELIRVSRPAIEAHGEDSWNGEVMVIPPLPPSFLYGCSIIDIHYILKLNVDPSGLGSNLEVPLEIIIGTTPLASAFQDYPPDITYPLTSVLPPGSMYPPPPPTTLENLPPPNYGPGTKDKVNVKEVGDEYTRGNMEFAPMYSYYKFG